MRTIMGVAATVAASAVMMAACGGGGGGEETTTSESNKPETTTSETTKPEQRTSDAATGPEIDFDADVDGEANLEAFSADEPGVQLLMHGVAGSKAGFVAVGSESESDTTLAAAAAVWWSEDGWNWERIVDDALEEASDMRAVVATDGGFVAVGGSGRGGDDAAVWLSADGRDWERVSDPDGVFTDGDMEAVAYREDGLVAAGSMTIGDVEVADYDIEAAIWQSSDGEEWERVPDSELPEAAEGVSSRSLNAVSASPDGFVVGGVQAGEPLLWRSTDGFTWEEIQSEAFAGGVSVGDIAVSDDAYVAVGSVGDLGDALPAIWYSADGDDWEVLETELDPEMFLLSVDVNDDDLFVITGPLDPGDLLDEEEVPTVSQVWASLDGQTWENLEFEEEEDATGSMFNVGVFANGYIAVGYEEKSAQIWIDELDAS